MSNLVHLFQSGASDEFAISNEIDGNNLPRAGNGLPWRYVESAELHRGAGSPTEWQARVAAIQAGIALNGHFVTELKHLPDGTFSLSS